MLFFTVLLFIIGLFIGSFLGVVSDRVPQGKSIILPASHCEFCNKTLKWYDNIPLLSFVLLGGKCRYCRKSLSILYPAIELITAFLFVGVYLNFQFTVFNFQTMSQFSISQTLSLLFYLFIVGSLIAIFFSDLKFELIPVAILYPAIIATLIFNFQFSIFNFLLAGIGSALLFLVLFAVTKGRGMGLGDLQLAFFMGLFLGFPKIALALYVAFLTGGLVSFILILWGKKKLKGSTIPFGPFLVFGTFVALFLGNSILLRFFPGL